MYSMIFFYLLCTCFSQLRFEAEDPRHFLFLHHAKLHHSFFFFFFNNFLIKHTTMNPNNNQQETNLPGYTYPPPPPTQFNQDAQPLGAVNINTFQQQQPVDTHAIPAYDHQQPPPSTAGYQPPMGDQKVPFTNDMKQPSEFGKNSALPGYGGRI